MNLQKFDQLSEVLLAKAKQVRDSKRQSYAPGTDVLANFKKDGEAVGVEPLQAWGLHSAKQEAAINAYVRYGVESEPIESRFIDKLNYLLLGWALINDQSLFGEELHD